MGYLILCLILWALLGGPGGGMPLEYVPLLPVMFGIILFVFCFGDW